MFYALRRHNVDALFVTNKKWGNLHVQPALDALNLKWTTARFAVRFQRGLRMRDWLGNLTTILVASITLFGLIFRYKPTHIHICNAEHFINFFPAIMLTRVPLIFRVGDKPATHRSLYFFLWKKLLIPRVNQFVCISKYVEGCVRTLGAPNSKTQVIYNQPPVRALRATKQLKVGRWADGCNLLYLGQLTRTKGVDVFVEAALRICSGRRNVQVLIAGDYKWRNPFAESLIADVDDAGLAKMILFLGFVEDVESLFHISDIHVIPSTWDEGLTNVVMEAKQAGVPSIVFPSGGVSEVICHKADGYICSDKTTSGIIDAIEYYLEAPQRIVDHGRAAKASLEKLGVTSFGERWNVVYGG